MENMMGNIDMYDYLIRVNQPPLPPPKPKVAQPPPKPAGSGYDEVRNWWDDLSEDKKQEIRNTKYWETKPKKKEAPKPKPKPKPKADSDSSDSDNDKYATVTKSQKLIFRP